MFWKKRKDEQNTPLNSAEIGEELTKAFAAIQNYESFVWKWISETGWHMGYAIDRWNSLEQTAIDLTQDMTSTGIISGRHVKNYLSVAKEKYCIGVMMLQAYGGALAPLAPGAVDYVNSWSTLVCLLEENCLVFSSLGLDTELPDEIREFATMPCFTNNRQ